MLTMGARISLLESTGESISSATVNIAGNNQSSEIGDILNVRKKVGNPFIVGVSKAGDGSTFDSNVNNGGTIDYYIGTEFARADGSFANPYQITINGSNITHFTIEFDTNKKRFPKSIVVDGVRHDDDDPIYTISGLSPSETHTIVIDNWNTIGYPVVISGIYGGVEININKLNIIQFSFSRNQRGDIDKPDFGIISNGGSLSFNDSNGEVKDYIESGILKEGVSISIYMENSIGGKKQDIANLIAGKWDYDTNSKKVSVECKDGLVELQEINIPEYNISDPITMADFYKDYLVKNTPKNYGFYSDVYGLKQSVRELLQSITIQYPYLDSGTLWSKWQGFCVACGLYIYKGENGRVVVDSEYEV